MGLVKSAVFRRQLSITIYVALREGSVTLPRFRTNRSQTTSVDVRNLSFVGVFLQKTEYH
jgi:hypothetical protein